MVLLCLLWGCGTTIIDRFEQCSIQGALNTEQAVPGDIVVVSGGPFGETWDNVVEVAGFDAEVVASVRAERVDESGEVIEVGACERCDTCRIRATGHCNRCYQACGNCVETLSFIVPEVEAGSTTVVVVNQAGATSPIPLEIISSTASDTGFTSTTTGTTPSLPDTGNP